MKKGLKIVLLILLGGLFVLLLGYVAMSLWNWLMPKIFGLTELTLIETFGLLLLAKIFFGFGFKGKGGGKDHWKWKKKFYQKYEGMSAEDRERFKTRMKEKWCSWEAKKSSSDQNSTSESQL